MASHADAQAAFEAAVEKVKNGPENKDASNEDKLKIYALFKQATQGDVTGSQPWAVNVAARAKWDAWAKLKGMSKEDAMSGYAAEVDSQMQG